MNLFLLKSAGIIALFLVIYKLFLEHDTYFKSIRMYFVTGILASFILPFISITKYVLAPQTQQFVYSKDFQNFASTSFDTPFNWTGFLFTIYIIGIALSGLYFTIQIISLFKILRTKSVKKFNNYKIIETQKDISPFSFFKYIVYNPSQFDAKEIQQLLKHEETHVLQRHSIDMLLAHMLTCVQWFNPFAWYYKKAITQNLEYIADKEAKFTIAPKNYSYLLLKTTKPNYQMVLANNFYNSLLKKRIMMLHKNHSPRLKQFKLALILPLLVGFVFAFNTQVVAQQKDNKDIAKIDLDFISITIDKDASKEDFDFIKSTFKKYGYKITFNKVKRNTKNEIIQIKINAVGNKTTAQYATKGNNPILPIEFKRDSKNNSLQIGATTPLHKPHNISSSFSYTISFDSIDDASLAKISNKLSKGLSKIAFAKGDSKHKSKGKNSFVFISTKDKGKNHASLFTKQKNNISATWIDDNGNKTDIIEVKKDGNVTKTIYLKTDKNGTISKTVRVDADKKVWKDKDDNITEIIEVLTDEKPHKLHKKYKIIKNNSKTTWKDKDGNIIKVIVVKTDKNGNITKTIKVDSDKEDQKFIVKEIDDDIHKVIDINASNNNNDAFVFSLSDGGTPLFVVDGKIFKNGIPKNLDPNTIKSIVVLKGIKATKKYGRKGKNGVIEITLKKKK